MEGATRRSGTMRLTTPTLGSFLSLCVLLCSSGWQGHARADAPPPSQHLSADPGPPRPRLGLSVNGIGIALADFAAHLDWAPEGFCALYLEIGESRRHGGDSVLAEVGLTLLPMDQGLEGFFVSLGVGIAWAGPWNGMDPNARSVGRAGGEVGWQFLWGDLSITLAVGATGFWTPEQSGVWAEPAGRAALGIVFR
jgi:hypothetical protein